MKRELVFFCALFISFSGMAQDHAPQARPALDETGEQLIDRLVKESWKKQGLASAPRIEDWEFLRRSSLDFLGRLPYPEEYDKFFAADEPNRRRQWCAYITEHEDMKQYWGRFWFETLVPVGQRRGVRTIGIGDGMRDWKRLAQNMLEGPLSETLRSFLQGEQVPLERVASEGRYNMVPFTVSTSQVLLGKSIQCAECHDHFFEPYTQDDFWALSANFRELRGGKKADEVSFKDFNGQEKTTKRSFFGEPVKQDDSLSDLFTGGRNFERAIVNQVWRQIFGLGLNAPNKSSQINDASSPVNLPHLLESLSDRFRAEGHNQHKLMNWICNSQVYSIGNKHEPQDEQTSAKYFAHIRPKQMTGPQFRRTMAGLALQTSLRNEPIFGQDPGTLDSASLPSEISGIDGSMTPQSILYLWNNPRFNEFLKKYWQETLKRNPKWSRVDALQYASKHLLGKPMPKDVLDAFLSQFSREGVTAEDMAFLTGTLMSTSHFISNR